MFFIILLPVSIYCLILFIFSFLFDYKKIESFSHKSGKNILRIVYIVMFSYLIYTLNDEEAGGWLTQLYLNIVDF